MTTAPSFTRTHPFLRVACFMLAVTAQASCREPQIAAKSTAPSAISVRVDTNGMTRSGKPYFVKGAGGSGSPEQLAARGANSIRTWTTGGLQEILDQSEKLGLTVSAGIWLESECSWFSYQNPEHCKKQTERVRKEVMAFRHHPALLAWGLGNEIEGDGSNFALWKQLDRLAVMLKEIDPAHPTYTAVAGANEAKVKGMMDHAPHLDFLGINTYGGIVSLRKHLGKIGWKRPWMLTEWGPRGFWESSKTSFNAPLEQTSSEKAAMIRSAYQKVITPNGGCLGSYVFVWGWKFEATATWFGIFTHEGETTAVADTLQEVWGGGKPANSAPAIQPMDGVPKAFLKAGTTFHAIAKATDPDGDKLTWNWSVLPEPKSHNGHNSPPMPKPLAGAVVSSMFERATINAPSKPGIYRLHVWVKDGKGHAATANVPFQVK